MKYEKKNLGRFNSGEEYVCISIKEETQSRVEIDFGLTDKYGRAIGCIAYIVRQSTALRDAETCGRGYCLDPEKVDALPEDGVQFGYRIQSTRNGKGFGASSHLNLCKDLEEAQAKLDKAVQNSIKRQTKTHGGA